VLTRGDDHGDPLYPASLRFKVRRWEKGGPTEASSWNAGRWVARQGASTARSAGDTCLGAASRPLGARSAVGDPDVEAQRRHVAVRVGALQHAERGAVAVTVRVALL
jgi:hypothetical protein